MRKSEERFFCVPRLFVDLQFSDWCIIPLKTVGNNGHVTRLLYLQHGRMASLSPNVYRLIRKFTSMRNTPNDMVNSVKRCTAVTLFLEVYRIVLFESR